MRVPIYRDGDDIAAAGVVIRRTLAGGMRRNAAALPALADTAILPALHRFHLTCASPLLPTAAAAQNATGRHQACCAIKCKTWRSSSLWHVCAPAQRALSPHFFGGRTLRTACEAQAWLKGTLPRQRAIERISLSPQQDHLSSRHHAREKGEYSVWIFGGAIIAYLPLCQYRVNNVTSSYIPLLPSTAPPTLLHGWRKRNATSAALRAHGITHASTYPYCRIHPAVDIPPTIVLPARRMTAER